MIGSYSGPHKPINLKNLKSSTDMEEVLDIKHLTYVVEELEKRLRSLELRELEGLSKFAAYYENKVK